MTSDSTEIVTFFVISDSAGETATKLAQATMAQYPTVEFNLFRRTFVTDEKTLRQALQDALEQAGVDTRVQTAIEMQEIAEPYIRRRAIRHLEKKRIVIFGAGLGKPYFSTDTTAALRAAEIEADAILMAKKFADGVYDSDPKTNPNAVKFDELTYNEIITKELKVMDATSTTLCKDNNIPIIVFSMDIPGNITKAAKGEEIGTIVRGE